MIRTIGIYLIILAFTSAVRGDQLKEHDNDVNYDESRVPYYDLPPLLISSEGFKISSPEAWRNLRRPQIVSLFSNLIYGRVPDPEIAITTDCQIVVVDDHLLNGKATSRKVILTFNNKYGDATIIAHIITPSDLKKPVPALMKLGIDGPIEEWIERGYGVIGIDQGGFVGHNEITFEHSIHRLFFKKGQSFPNAQEWGVLSAIAWGHSRVLDFLETDEEVDASRVAIMGHSKTGKAALWTAAQDERFALVISAQSGCAGAALWRRRSGETLEKMVTRFPYWLCRNAWKFVDQEDDLPVDQHMLLALIAPRPVYIASGIEDMWADPRGEYASAYNASEVYQLLGKTGISSEELPPVRQAIIESDVGYHIREGGHSVEPYDWAMFMDFCDHHLKR